jgi:hypothetical protein
MLIRLVNGLLSGLVGSKLDGFFTSAFLDWICKWIIEEVKILHRLFFFLLPSFRTEEGNPGIWAVHTARLAAPWVFTSHGLPCSYLIHVYTGTTCVHNTMRQCIGS